MKEYHAELFSSGDVDTYRIILSDRKRETSAMFRSLGANICPLLIQ